MADTIRVIQYGLGPIGRAVARHVVERAGVELVGGVDIDASKVGRDVGQVIGLEQSLGFSVVETLAGVHGRVVDMALHALAPEFFHIAECDVQVARARALDLGPEREACELGEIDIVRQLHPAGGQDRRRRDPFPGDVAEVLPPHEMQGLGRAVGLLTVDGYAHALRNMGLPLLDPFDDAVVRRVGRGAFLFLRRGRR